MTEETENLVLEILKRMQADMSSMKADISQLKTDVAELKARMTNIEANVVGLVKVFHTFQEAVTFRMEQFDHRLTRLEDQRGFAPHDQ